VGVGVTPCDLCDPCGSEGAPLPANPGYTAE